MGLQVTITPQKYRFLDPGMYRAKLINVAEGVGKYGPIFIPRFDIIKPKYEGCWIDDLINQVQTGHNGKIHRMIRALTGYECKVQDVIDLSDLVDRECYIDVEQHGKNNKIREYIPLRNLQDIE